MTTYRFMPHMSKGLGRFIVAILVGGGLALQCLFPSVALARPSGKEVAFTASTQDSDLLNKVGVSIVRLKVFYRDAAGAAQGIVCTGLGTLVGSIQVDQGVMYSNTVLTDGNLVNTALAACGSATGSTYILSEIQILASGEYSQNAIGGYTLQTLECNSQRKLICSDQLSNSIAIPEVLKVISANTSQPTDSESSTLFSFSTLYPQPFVVADLTTNSAQFTVIGLINPTTGKPYLGPNVPTSQQTPGPETYLQPQVLDAGTTSKQANAAASSFESGTPAFNSLNEVNGIYVGNSNKLSLPQANLSLQGLALAGTGNPLKQSWDTGIDAYNQGAYTQATKSLGQIISQNMNPNFKAAQTFATSARNALLTPTPGSTNRPVTSGGTSSSNNGLSVWLLVGLGCAIVALILLLLLVMVLVGRTQKRRRELGRFAAEQQEAQRQAEEEVQRQRAQREVFCPNCHHQVHAGDSICPNCRFPLSPTASGLGVRLAASAPLPPLQNAMPLPPVLPPISEQPTVQFPPRSAPLSPFPAVHGDNMPERTVVRRKPTREEQPDYDLQTVPTHGPNLNLVVGTRSDPGLKRKYKPNEDSLFAMQGARTHNSQPQQFGLFVIADGMGGHANGQDASRRAIQTMIDFMLPRISSSEPMDDDAFLKLLAEGVQNANQAVHQRNLEVRADMGTTMTSSLVVGSMAYVANVGDSRTYLYREGQGLSKVTHDHSVVASLVDAGIIQPDDIYTHPKRNQIYRSLGEKSIVEVDTFKVTLQPGDKILLCSDGLWDMVRDPLIQSVLGKTTSDPNRTGQELIRAALDGGGEDNVSVIVVQLEPMEKPTGQTGIQLLAKPETVTLPSLPPVE